MRAHSKPCFPVHDRFGDVKTHIQPGMDYFIGFRIRCSVIRVAGGIWICLLAGDTDGDDASQQKYQFFHTLFFANIEWWGIFPPGVLFKSEWIAL